MLLFALNAERSFILMIKQRTEFEKFGRLIEKMPYRYATTMKDNPHSYTMRAEWKDDNNFDWAVQYIREHGYNNYYKGYQYTQIDVNEYFYWTMGAKIEDTILINRKVRNEKVYHDHYAEAYYKRFQDKASHLENKKVFKIIGDVTNQSVLDIGCGTGLFLEYTQPLKYLGIDPSCNMLSIMKRNWPRAKTIKTDLKRFVGGRYDIVACLFGVPNYFTSIELNRLPELVHIDGRVIVMLYKDDYEPISHGLTDVEISHNKYIDIENILPGAKRHNFNNHILYDWKRNE